jgi:cobyrinic acid a,c-diamide synthase
LLYLARDLDGHPMCGVLDSSGVMTPRLKLGYRDAVALAPSALFEEGRRITGHEFHRTVMTPPAGTAPAWRWAVDGDPAPPEGFVQGGLHASYLHVHPAGSPDAVARFVARCAAHRRRHTSVPVSASMPASESVVPSHAGSVFLSR